MFPLPLIQEIYCSGCHARKFGTAGYRGITSTAWADQSDQSQLAMNHHQCGTTLTTTRTAVFTTNTSSSTQAIKGEEGGLDTCIRCSGKVRST